MRRGANRKEKKTRSLGVLIFRARARRGATTRAGRAAMRANRGVADLNYDPGEEEVVEEEDPVRGKPASTGSTTAAAEASHCGQDETTELAAAEASNRSNATRAEETSPSKAKSSGRQPSGWHVRSRQYPLSAEQCLLTLRNEYQKV